MNIWDGVSKSSRVGWGKKRTSALVQSILDGLSSLGTVARLLRTVTNTVGPVGPGAEAGLVISWARELGAGDQVHVVDAQLLKEG